MAKANRGSIERPKPEPVIFGREMQSVANDTEKIIISPEIQMAIQSLIITTIQNRGDVTPESSVYSSIFQYLQPSIPLDKAREFVAETIKILLDRGEIMRLFYKAQGIEHIDYYPKETEFRLAGHSLFGSLSPAQKPFLNPDDQSRVDSYVNLLSTGVSRDMMLSILASFCPQCGSLSDGHICSKRKL